ncbi:MAG: hypothetical protein LBT00_07080, partial [Spirochaetaceae bacterium]|nr:hypothetical protein [Spirochaetaceae bacterium]
IASSLTATMLPPPRNDNGPRVIASPPVIASREAAKQSGVTAFTHAQREALSRLLSYRYITAPCYRCITAPVTDA